VLVGAVIASFLWMTDSLPGMGEEPPPPPPATEPGASEPAPAERRVDEPPTAGAAAEEEPAVPDGEPHAPEEELRGAEVGAAETGTDGADSTNEPAVAPTKRPRHRGTRGRAASTVGMQATPAGTGTLNLLAIPRAEVSIQGRSLGRTPLAAVELPSGRQTLTLQPIGGGPTRQLVVTIRPGERTSRSVSLDSLHTSSSVVVTNPRIWRELASTPRQAAAQIAAWCGSPSLALLGESEGFVSVLEPLLTRPRVRGPVVHDARVAAICLAHGVEALLTRDRDFSLFPELETRDPFA
jgi:predicted nucleic acid-binding protein